MPDRPTLPDWPAVLDCGLAAAYVSLSETSFRASVVPEVPPIHLTQRRIGWRRADLDRWIASRPAGEAQSVVGNPWDE